MPKPHYLDSSSSLSSEKLRALMAQHPLLLIRGLDTLSRSELLELVSLDTTSLDTTSLDTTMNTGETYRDLLHWEFGPVMELKEDPSTTNYLFSNERVPFHWDGAFYQVPSHLVFHCLEAPLHGGGGETLFSDTAMIWEEANETDRRQWQKIVLHYETEKKAHYGGSFSTSLVNKHPRSAQTVLKFAEQVETHLNPVSLQIEGAEPGFKEQMQHLIYSPRYCYTHAWRPGDLLIVDNHQFIHGRNGFETASPRHIRRVQIL